MIFTELNDGSTQNLVQIYKIDIQDTDVVYYSAKGSLEGYHEHFKTKADAQQRYEELQQQLIIK